MVREDDLDGERNDLLEQDGEQDVNIYDDDEEAVSVVGGLIGGAETEDEPPVVPPNDLKPEAKIERDIERIIETEPETPKAGGREYKVREYYSDEDDISAEDEAPAPRALEVPQEPGAGRKPNKPESEEVDYSDYINSTSIELANERKRRERDGRGRDKIFDKGYVRDASKNPAVRKERETPEERVYRIERNVPERNVSERNVSERNVSERNVSERKVPGGNVPGAERPGRVDKPVSPDKLARNFDRNAAADKNGIERDYDSPGAERRALREGVPMEDTGKMARDARVSREGMPNPETGRTPRSGAPRIEGRTETRSEARTETRTEIRNETGRTPREPSLRGSDRNPDRNPDRNMDRNTEAGKYGGAAKQPLRSASSRRAEFFEQDNKRAFDGGETAAFPGMRYIAIGVLVLALAIIVFLIFNNRSLAEALKKAESGPPTDEAVMASTIYQALKITNDQQLATIGDLQAQVDSYKVASSGNTEPSGDGVGAYNPPNGTTGTSTTGNVETPNRPQPTTPPPPSATRTHTVVAGDLLGRLARTYLGSESRWREIRDLNGLNENGDLSIGMVLQIPAQ